jgi:glycosyltransferase involved in cell wall biosynthesis
MIKKKRILWNGEATFLNTGYAVYGREVLQHLYDTGKYEIAELGSYGHMNDSRRFEIPWRYYGNLPDNEQSNEQYQSSTANQFGAWKFNHVVEDFRPDFVLDIRDWWMMSYVAHSPMRHMFRWFIMPPVDSLPQKDIWMQTYMSADKVFAYSEFGRDGMLSACKNHINFADVASPSANYEKMKPCVDKKSHKKNFGLDENSFIVGTVMRNQSRKLYPDLFDAFAQFIKNSGTVGQKTYLYVHTAFPDLGWDIPRLLRMYGIGHKVIFSYHCGNCQHVFPSFFNDAAQPCPKCGKFTAGMPNTNRGLTTEQLADVYNCFDFYVQYSTCEGWGMPVVEAASCGVPIAAVNYSATSSILKKIGGYAIDVQRMYLESDSHSYRAYPNNTHLAQILEKFFSLPENERRRKSEKIAKNVREHYGWQKTAKKWEYEIDATDTLNRWDDPPCIHIPNQNIPQNISNEHFVKWCIANIWGNTQFINSFIAHRMIRNLNYGQAISNTGGKQYNELSTLDNIKRYSDFTRQHVVDETMQLCALYNHWEEIRSGMREEDTPDFIKYAKPDNKEIQS